MAPNARKMNPPFSICRMRLPGRMVLFSLGFAAAMAYEARAAGAFQQTLSGNYGVVVMEGENATARVTAQSHSWTNTTQSGTSGGTVIQATPDNGLTTDDTTGPRADYHVNFQTTGTYYVWVRVWGSATSSDSIHAGFKSVLLTGGGGFTSSGDPAFRWDNTVGSTRITMNVTSAAIHIFNLWMREDGAMVDKIVLTQDPNYTPTGNGPSESAFVTAPVITSSTNATGGVGTIFTYRITASNFPTSFGATNLPPGLSVDADTGVIEGRPTQAGNFDTTISATNAGGKGTTHLFTTVAAAPAPVTTIANFKSALDAAVPGSIIVLANGTYHNFAYKKHTKSGTAAQPIHIRAQTPGAVTFSGNFQLEVVASHIVIDGFRLASGQPNGAQSAAFKIIGDNNRLTECSIIGFNRTDDARWVSLNGNSCRVDHCYFSGKNCAGVLLEVIRPDSSTDYHLIDHNVFRNFSSGSGANGWETIRIGTGAQGQTDSYTTITRNYFENCDGETECISIKAGRNVISENTLVNCQGTITIRDGRANLATGNVILNTLSPAKVNCGGFRICDSDNVVRDNYISGVRTTNTTHIGGVVVMSSEATSPPSHRLVVNATIDSNSIINCQQSFVYGGGNYGVPPDSAAFTNNIARNNIGGSGQFNIVRQTLAIDSPTYSGEIYYGSALGLPSVPSGVATSPDPNLQSTVINGHTFYFALSGTAGTDASHLAPLQQGDVGPNDYVP